jgi:hypothetical protein
MAQKSKNKKSLIQTTLKQERKAAIRDPEGKKSVLDKTAMLAELASYGIPIGTAAALTTKGVFKLLTKYKNYQKVQNTRSISLYRGEPGYKTFSQIRNSRGYNPELGKWFSSDKGEALRYSKKSLQRFSDVPNELGVLKKVNVSPNELKAIRKGRLKDTQVNRGFPGRYNDKDYFHGTVTPEVRRRAKVIPKEAGGVVKKRTNVTKSDNKYDTSSKKKWVRR